jgi:hypothetical protein
MKTEVKKPISNGQPIPDDKLKRMWISRHLLPDPAPGVVEELINEIYRLKKLLKKENGNVT